VPRSWIVAALAVAAVAVGVGMVLLGLPEATPTQTVLLELSSLPLSAALALGVWTVAGRLRPWSPVTRWALTAAGVAVATGLGLIATAYLAGPRTLVHLGQTVVWLSLLAAMLYVIARSPRRQASRFRLIEEDDPASVSEPK